jgi:surface antigen
VRLWANEYLGGPAFNGDWTAYLWDDHARAAGLAVGTTPQSNAIVVFERESPWANDASGHLGWVNAVHPDGSFTISDMNIDGVPYSTRDDFTLATTDLAHGSISFIY